MSGLPAFATSGNTCGVMGLLQSASLFDKAIVSAASALTGQISGLVSQLENIPNEILQNIELDIQGAISSLEGVAANAVASLVSHLTSQLTGLISNMSMATSALSAHLGLMASGCGLPSLMNSGTSSLNPCAGMSTFFGSIMGAGQALISAMSGAIGSAVGGISSFASAALGALQGIANGISSAIASVASIGNQITSMISGEISALTGAAADMLSFAASSTLLSLLNNPCAAMVINAVASPELSSIISV